jgi:hypothetical protein
VVTRLPPSTLGGAHDSVQPFVWIFVMASGPVGFPGGPIILFIMLYFYISKYFKIKVFFYQTLV